MAYSNGVYIADPTTPTQVANVKAASTPAAATDDALVVAISPNNTVGITQATLTESTAAWTSATALNTAVTVNVAGYSTVVVTLNQTTTITGGIITFEVSDTTGFTVAYPILGLRSNSLQTGGISIVSGAYTLQANTNTTWVFAVAGWAAFRVRLSTVISGTGTVNVGITSSAASNYVYALNTPSVSPQTVLSNATPQTLADNLGSSNTFPSSNGLNNPLSVAESVYGGAFSGAASASLQGWSKRRAPTVFKTAQATASGNTAVWTPGTGNKFRLLKVFVQLTDNASIASGAVVTVSLQDSSTAMPIAFDVFVPTTAVTTVIGDGLDQELDLGDLGVLSAAANNVLNVNLSATLATGNVRIITMGTEE